MLASLIVLHLNLHNKQEAEALVRGAFRSLAIAERFVENEFNEAMKWTNAKELDEIGIPPATFLSLALFGLMQFAKKRGYVFAVCLNEAEQMETQVEAAFEVLEATLN